MAPVTSAVKREHDDDDYSDDSDDSRDDYGGTSGRRHMLGEGAMDYSVTSPGYSSTDSGGASNHAGGPSYSGNGLGTSGAPRRATGPRKPRSGAPLNPEEEERRRMRRERNKFAAAKCRQKRVDLTNSLLEETQSLEQEQQRLHDEIKSYQQEKEELEFILEAHRLHCGVDTAAMPVSVSSKASLLSAPLPLVPEQHSLAPAYALPVLKVEGASEPVILQISQTVTGPKIAALQTLTGAQTLAATPLSGLVTAGEEAVVVSSAGGCKVQVMHKRPSTLGTATKAVRASKASAVSSAVSSDAVNVFTIGLESMIDGHTGLTPITGMPAAVPLLATPSGVLPASLLTTLSDGHIPENLSSKGVVATRSMVTL